MISSTFGARLGGTTVGGHQGVESLAFSLITPPNGGGGGGSCFPSMVVVAAGEPGVPVVCWAAAGKQARRRRSAAENANLVFMTRLHSGAPARAGAHTIEITANGELYRTRHKGQLIQSIDSRPQLAGAVLDEYQASLSRATLSSGPIFFIFGR